MLERKRKQTMTCDIWEEQEPKKKRTGISDCMTAFPEALILTKAVKSTYQPLVSEMSTTIPRYDVKDSPGTGHHQMKNFNGGYMRMDVDVDVDLGKGNLSSLCQKPVSVPSCAKCAAGQGGHISHLHS